MVNELILHAKGLQAIPNLSQVRRVLLVVPSVLLCLPWG